MANQTNTGLLHTNLKAKMHVINGACLLVIIQYNNKLLESYHQQIEHLGIVPPIKTWQTLYKHKNYNLFLITIFK